MGNFPVVRLAQEDERLMTIVQPRLGAPLGPRRIDKGALGQRHRHPDDIVDRWLPSVLEVLAWLRTVVAPELGRAEGSRRSLAAEEPQSADVGRYCHLRVFRVPHRPEYDWPAGRKTDTGPCFVVRVGRGEAIVLPAAVDDGHRHGRQSVKKMGGIAAGSAQNSIAKEPQLDLARVSWLHKVEREVEVAEAEPGRRRRDNP